MKLDVKQSLENFTGNMFKEVRPVEENGISPAPCCNHECQGDHRLETVEMSLGDVIITALSAPPKKDVESKRNIHRFLICAKVDEAMKKEGESAVVAFTAKDLEDIVDAVDYVYRNRPPLRARATMILDPARIPE